MYLNFYGFSAPPFEITPDPPYLFYSCNHRAALEHVLFGLQQRKGFIAHRLAVAGANGRPTFTAPAWWLLPYHSRGLPRLINALCDTTLLASSAEGCEALGVRHVRRAARALAGRDR